MFQSVQATKSFMFDWKFQTTFIICGVPPACYTFIFIIFLENVFERAQHNILKSKLKINKAFSIQFTFNSNLEPYR